MIGEIKTGGLANAEISAVIHEGLTVKTKDGKTAYLVVIDSDGNIVESGPGVAKEAFLVSIASYKKLLKGLGHLRVTSQKN